MKNKAFPSLIQFSLQLEMGILEKNLIILPPGVIYTDYRQTKQRHPACMCLAESAIY